ncbi:hypothetical protein [Methylorubrum sp. DB1722]|jgi:hypothetical protein|uniref:hypothetical protein n=1 Tax=Methylorubrum sp. DB1722 TaxID=2478916 RepID=UPI0018E3E87E|nr:hypothetical protein [Methylorubrum sp. DB1722]
MDTLEFIFAWIAFIAVGLPICIVFATVVIVGIPITAWYAWNIAILFVRLIYGLAREEWDRRRDLRAGA